MTAPSRSYSSMTATPVQTTALIFGVVFLVVGILGFIPGITTNYDQLMFAGHGSEAMLFGVFQVSILHNIVHLLFGVAGFLFSRAAASARSFLIWGGVVYAVLLVYGLVVPQGQDANFVPVNTADNWLHLILAVAMIASGLLLTRDRAGRAVPPAGRL